MNKNFIFLIFYPIVFLHATDLKRQVIHLNGLWQIEQGSLDTIPQEFTHTIPVPGLADMADPPFSEVGFKSDERQAFWYRRTFKIDGPVTEVALLKIHKACYGTRVFLNGQLAGEHLPCFTPVTLNVTSLLKGKGRDNELVIRVGADRSAVPETIPTGWDFEKYKYIPGIYDDVDLILTASPEIVRIQAVPEIESNIIRLVTNVRGGSKKIQTRLEYTIREVSGGRVVASAISPVVELDSGDIRDVDQRIVIPQARLWSPEDPFLYECDVKSAGDQMTVKFGMRSFTFDKNSGRAILNGKPYFMRGTNVCIYRFFEDVERKYRPWDKGWVRRLHKQFKSMNWNSIRYCIGFPPELWYDIADAEGFLIQDEFPIWFLGEENWPGDFKSAEIAKEYTEWMQERWNHPCVVIWDGQNETTTEETGTAIQMVRHLDLSGRPWDNGWAAPQSENDCIETHPYLFIRDWSGGKPFSMSELKTMDGKPGVMPSQENLQRALIINEYAWLWLNRDGTPTSLTIDIYRKLLGTDASIPQMRYLYARLLAAKTEFWRSHRQCAGVLHFCGLGYSRPGGLERPVAGATSDHFVDLEALNFEPNFEKYVRDAFAPVGLMLDVWEEQYKPGSPLEVPVWVINDLYQEYTGQVKLRLYDGRNTVTELEKPVAVSGLGREMISFNITLPARSGNYQLNAELISNEKKPVQSWRDFKVAPPE